jgi:hypothetical protein
MWEGNRCRKFVRKMEITRAKNKDGLRRPVLVSSEKK